MAIITFDVTEFRILFPEFADDTAYPDAVLQMYWDSATCYLSDQDYGCLSGNCRKLALNYMTAHLARISTMAQTGGVSGQVQSSTVDKVSVSLTPPPNQDQFDWWLGTTPYGSQLSALLAAKIAGGLYIGGRPEKSAFRKVGGIF